ncbi:hypothetical protein [Streptomyces sp. NBC_00038]|uniref:hypothetical protein n=1 Tax=Streptomyces sp. NBC_00038 TaxID=2903615 RepID=UPI0022515E32|nr:hypothetical protein [Streptomyces sp. NBC_00038]MCX5555364.1 hypothetical protein [Streptomyces sp. NBC_00038]
MPTDPAHPAPAREPATDATAVLDTEGLGPSEAGYGARYAEDSFDYPSPAPSQSWAVGVPPPGPGQDDNPATESDSADGGQRRAGPVGARSAGRWQQLAVRRRPALSAAAALVVMGGFGLALSVVSDTVSSNPVPGGADGTAQVSAPKSPAAPSPPSEATASAPPPAGSGAGAAPTASALPTGLPPGTGERRDDEGGGDGREDHGREDGDRADAD